MNPSTTFTDHTVAVYQTHTQAEDAVKVLSDSGYNMKNLSIVGQNYATEEHPIGFINTGDRMLTWGKFGAFWGGLWGMLFGSAMLLVPGVGAIVFAGWLVSILEGAVLVGGFSALIGALTTIGVPKDSIVKYETALKAGSFLLIAHGTEAEVLSAKNLLANSSATSLDSFSTQQLAGSR